MAMKMHESLVDVVDNGDGTFTISRGKLVSLVQGTGFHGHLRRRGRGRG